MKILKVSAVLFLSLLWLSGNSSFAQQEQITITTYYPAPFGIYRELRADQMSVGSAYRTQAVTDGNLIISGNVGIGATSPQSRLSINTSSTSPGSMLEINNRGDQASGSWSALRFGLDSASYPNQYAKGGIIYESRDGWNRGRLHLAVNNVAGIMNIALADALLTADGTSRYVGIGTTSPETQLHVNRLVSDGEEVIRVRGRNAGNPTPAGGLGVDWNGALWGTSLFHQGNKVFTVESNYGALIGAAYQAQNAPAGGLLVEGMVGIGTPSPGYNLTVNGTTWCTAGAWAGSDEKFKSDVQILPGNTLNKILRLRGVSFRWKQESFIDLKFPKERQIGIIAQEMEKEFPELVITDAQGYKAIAYDRFTAVLLEAIKAQQNEIENLMTKINVLEERLNNLEK